MSDDNGVTDMLNYDNVDRPLIFFIKVFCGVLGGLCLGSLIDSLCRILQKDDTSDWRQRPFVRSLLFFLIQIALNIIILLVICMIFPLTFLEWLQLTISGSLFAAILFIAQQNLVNNALRIFYIA
jgi:hypothetical protein